RPEVAIRATFEIYVALPIGGEKQDLGFVLRRFAFPSSRHNQVPFETNNFPIKMRVLKELVGVVEFAFDDKRLKCSRSPFWPNCPPDDSYRDQNDRAYGKREHAHD